MAEKNSTVRTARESEGYNDDGLEISPLNGKGEQGHHEADIADVSEVIGDFGIYHFVLILINFMGSVPTAWTLTSIDFLAGDVPHHCAPLSNFNGTLQEWRDMGIPPVGMSGNANNFSSCQAYTVHSNGSIDDENVITCDAWVYDQDALSSAVVDWNLVCDQTLMRSMIQSVVFMGQLIGSLMFGRLSDRFGRKRCYCVAVIMMICTGVSASFAESVTVYNTIRLMQAMSSAGLQTLAAQLYSEVSLPKDRHYLHLGFTFGLCLSTAALPFVAKLLNDWRMLQRVTGLSAGIMIPFIFIIRESPRWLISQKMGKQAETTIRSILSINGRDSKETVVKVMPKLMRKADEGTTKAHGLLDIWPHKNLRKNVLLLFVFWFLHNMYLFGVIYLPAKLGGDRSVNFSVATFGEIPGALIALPVIRYCRRRISFTVIMICCCIFSTANALIPPEFLIPRLIFIFLSRAMIIVSNASLWVYTMELLPTSARSFGFACCFFFGRTGGAIAPFLRDLSDWSNAAPHAILAGISLIASTLLRMTPETLNRNLPDSIAESERLGKKNSINVQT